MSDSSIRIDVDIASVGFAHLFDFLTKLMYLLTISIGVYEDLLFFLVENPVKYSCDYP